MSEAKEQCYERYSQFDIIIFIHPCPQSRQQTGSVCTVGFFSQGDRLAKNPRCHCLCDTVAAKHSNMHLMHAERTKNGLHREKFGLLSTIKCDACRNGGLASTSELGFTKLQCQSLPLSVKWNKQHVLL